MLSLEPGWTVAKPPDTARHQLVLSTLIFVYSVRYLSVLHPALSHVSVGRTEELLGTAGLLDDLDNAGLELLDGRDVAGEDTHLTALGGDVHLYAGIDVSD